MKPKLCPHLSAAEVKLSLGVSVYKTYKTLRCLNQKSFQTETNTVQRGEVVETFILLSQRLTVDVNAGTSAEFRRNIQNKVG